MKFQLPIAWTPRRGHQLTCVFQPFSQPQQKLNTAPPNHHIRAAYPVRACWVAPVALDKGTRECLKSTQTQLRLVKTSGQCAVALRNLVVLPGLLTWRNCWHVLCCVLQAGHWSPLHRKVKVLGNSWAGSSASIKTWIRKLKNPPKAPFLTPKPEKMSCLSFQEHWKAKQLPNFMCWLDFSLVTWSGRVARQPVQKPAQVWHLLRICFACI